VNAFEGFRADIVWDANTGQAIRDIGALGEQYLKTTGAMSDEALRAALAQEKLSRAIRTGGPESMAAQRATLAYRSEMQSLAAASNEAAAAQERQAVAAREAGVASAEASRLQVESQRFARGGLVGAGVGRSGLLFGSTSFIAGIGVATVLRTTLAAAKNEEVALAQLQVALADTGHSWDAYSARVEAGLDAQVKSTAFTRDELTTALAANVRRFGDVNQALEANAIDADVARAKGIGLAEAQALIQKASFGNSRALQQLGIDFTKTTASQDALKDSTKHASQEQKDAAKAADLQANELSVLDAVNARYHGNAARFLETSAGKQALFNAELTRSKEIIGQALLPTFNRLITGLSDYLDRMNRTGQLERDVRTVTHDLGLAFHGVEDALRLIRSILGPVNELLGGTRHSVELLTLALIALKLRGFFPIGAAAKTAAAETTVLDGELAALAAAGPIDVPIVVSITLAAGGAALLARLEKWGGTGISRAFGGSPRDTTRPLTASGYPPLADWTDEEKAAFAAQHGPGTYDYYLHHLDAATRIDKAALTMKPAVTHGPGSAHTNVLHPVTTRPGAPILGLTERQLTPLYRAEGTPGTADDLAALRGQLTLLNRLLGQKGLTPGQLNQLLQQRNAVTDQIASILTTNASEAKTRADKAAAAAKKAAEAKKKAHDALVKSLEEPPLDLRIALQTAVAHGASEDKQLSILREERAVIERQVHELVKIGAAKSAILKARTNEAGIQKKIDALTKAKTANAGANMAQVLAAINMIEAKFAGNAFPLPGTGKLETHGYDTVHELRQIKSQLVTIASAGRFPASGRALISADSVGG
jgi:hypothetical protein